MAMKILLSLAMFGPNKALSALSRSNSVVSVDGVHPMRKHVLTCFSHGRLTPQSLESWDLDWPSYAWFMVTWDSLFWKSNVSHVRTAGFYRLHISNSKRPEVWNDGKWRGHPNLLVQSNDWIGHPCLLVETQHIWNVNLSHKNTTYFQLNPHICPGKYPFVFVLNPNLLLGRIHLAEPIMFSCV